MRCCGIGPERSKSCGDRPEKRVMCARPHPASEHQCRVKEYSRRKGKLCAHVITRCANCQGNHTANSGQCSSRQKAENKARKKKAVKSPKLLAESTVIPIPNIKEEYLGPSDQEMDKRED